MTDNSCLVAFPRAKLAGMAKVGQAKYCVGQVVRHRFFPFRGVIFDVDPNFANTEEYVSEQNLLPDETGEPVRHPQVRQLFGSFENGAYRSRGVTN
jgi:heat shock protein HspQ